MKPCRRNDFWYYGVVSLLALLAIVPRLIVLEERPLHHDEAQHAWYGYSVSLPHGHYVHSPILHGPSLMLLTGLTYKMFGDSIGIGRGMVALFSLVAMVAAAALWPRRYRWWLFALIVTSPYLLYYGRFLRNELIFCALVLIGVLGFARSLQGRSLGKRAAWGMLGPAPIVALLAFKENALFVMASGVCFGGVWIAVKLAKIIMQRRELPAKLEKKQKIHPAFRRSRGPIISPETFATLSGWLAGLIVGTAYVLVIYGITTQDGTFSPIDNINRSIKYWAGQQTEHRISGTLYYHLPIMMTYELPILLMLAAGLIVDALRSARRTFIYLVSIAAWLALWGIWHAISPSPGPLGAIERFLHIEVGIPLLVLGLLIVPLLTWSFFAINEHLVLGSWMAFWAACSLFQYSVAGEKVPWLAVHIMLPIYMTLGWIWAPILRRSSFSLKSLAAIAVIAATLIAARNDYYLIGPRTADPVERMVYNHTTVEYDHMCREWLSRWTRLAKDEQRPLNHRRVSLVGDLGWPGVWYFRHCGYDLPSQPPETVNGWDMVMGTRGEMTEFCQKIDSPRWGCTAMSLRDHWTPNWPEGTPSDQWLAWWRYYWFRQIWGEKGHFEILVAEPIGR